MEEEHIGPEREPERRSRLKGPWWYSERRSVSPEQRDQVLSQLFYEGADRVPFLVRFSTLMAMAVAVAVFGLARDSASVVIGAMLISPLTTPLLGLATSLVLGQPPRQLVSALIIAAASAGGIALAAAVMFVIPEAKNLTADSEQLLARTRPDILDLAVAVVAGAAGAYVLVRREAVSALPGVAIAVALVPPLATVGIMLEIGEGEMAADALLLYLTNLAGIILAASVVMLLMGVGPRPGERGLPRRIRIGLATAALGALLVAIPLVVHTARTVHDARDREDAERQAQQWVDGTGLRVGDVTLEESDEVKVEVFGPQSPPDAGDLAAAIAADLEEEVALTVVWTPERTESLRGRPSS